MSRLGNVISRVELSLYPGLDNVEWTRHYAGQTPRSGCCENLQSQTNFFAPSVLLRPLLRLFVKSKLEGRKREVTEKSGSVSVEQGRKSLFFDNGAGSVERRSVVVP